MWIAITQRVFTFHYTESQVLQSLLKKLLPFSNGKLVKNATLADWRTHDGVDIRAEVGDKVCAMADGTVTRAGYSLLHVNYFPYEGESGWYVPPMGYPGDHGTYSVSGNLLVTTYTCSDVEEFDAPFVSTSSVLSLDGDSMVLDNEYGTFVKSEQYIEPLTLCGMLGVDTSAE